METEKEKRTPQERWERATIADIKLNDRTYKVFFNAKEYDKMPDKELREFFKYLCENTPPGSEFVSSIDSKVRLARTDADTRRYSMTWGQEIALAVEEEQMKRETAVKETARRFLAMGLLPEQVAQGSGLSLAQIQELQKDTKSTEA